MSALDLGIILVYLVGCTMLGSRLGRGRGQDLKGYLLGERAIPAWAVMISIVATETSAATFLSVPGLAYRGDMTYLQLAFGFLAARIVVALVLLPAYFQGEIDTAYEVLAARFGGATQKAASILFLVTRTLGSGIRLFLAAKVLEVITRWPLPASILIIGVSTLLYTYLGGLKGVIWADVLQFAVYMLGAFVALIVLARAVPGGWSAILDRANTAGKLRVWDFTTDLTIPFTFWAGLIGGLVLDMGTHGADHMMVQRYLSARSQRAAAGALIASGFVIVAQFALFLVIGAAIWVLYQSAPPPVLPGKDQEFASFIVRVSAPGRARPGDRGRLLGDDEHRLGCSQRFGRLDGQRPDPPALSRSPGGLVSEPLEMAHRRLGPGPDCRGLRRDAADAIGRRECPGHRGVRDGHPARFVPARPFRPRAGQHAAFVGMIVGLIVVTTVAFGTKLAWSWYALVGAGTVCIVGWGVSLLRPVIDKKDIPVGAKS